MNSDLNNWLSTAEISVQSARALRLLAGTAAQSQWKASKQNGAKVKLKTTQQTVKNRFEIFSPLYFLKLVLSMYGLPKGTNIGLFPFRFLAFPSFFFQKSEAGRADIPQLQQDWSEKYIFHYYTVSRSFRELVLDQSHDQWRQKANFSRSKYISKYYIRLNSSWNKINQT